MSDTPAPVFYGRYSDGRTAASSDADVRLVETGLEIALTGSGTRLLWPYASLTTAEPITPHAIDALVSSSLEPGAALFVSEGTFARQLADKAPQLSAHAQRMRHARPWIAVAAILLAVGATMWIFDISPSNAIARRLPDGARKTLGDHVMASMIDGRRACDAAPGQAALDRLTEKLATAAGISKPFKVVVVDWSLVNAFAVPGEKIMLTREIIEKADGPDEVAGVLAHEMGHGIEMHPETSLVRALGMTAAVELMMGGSNSTLANAGVLLAQLSYTRDAEREADEHALRILRAGGISASGLAGFFRRVIKLEGGTEVGATASSGLDILSTHPATEERIARVEREATYPSSPAMSAADWTALKGICGEKAKGRGDDAPLARRPRPQRRPSDGSERDI